MSNRTSQVKGSKAAPANAPKKAKSIQGTKAVDVEVQASQRNRLVSKRNVAPDSDNDDGEESEKENEVPANHQKRSRADVLNNSGQMQVSSVSSKSTSGISELDARTLCRESLRFGHLNLSAESARIFMEQNNLSYVPREKSSSDQNNSSSASTTTTQINSGTQYPMARPVNGTPCNIVMVQTPKSSKGKKPTKGIKKPFILGDFDNIAITYINRDAAAALLSMCHFPKRCKNARKREYAIRLRLENGEFMIIIVTEQFYLLCVVSNFIIANDFGVEKMAQRIVNYATVRGKFVPNVTTPGQVLDIMPLLHIDLVNAFLMDQANPVQVNTLIDNIMHDLTLLSGRNISISFQSPFQH